MDLREMLEALSRCAAPSGFEEPAARLACELLQPYMDEISTDIMGNVLAVKRCGVPGAKTVMLDAHIDEVGFIVTGFEGGFVRFAPLGGIDARLLPASRLKLLTVPPIFGIVDVMPPHLLKDDDGDKASKIDDLYLDVGLSAEKAAELIPLGTPCVYETEPFAMGDKLAGKAFDDRAGFASLVRALELLGDCKLPFDLCVLASTQEEVGRRGAVTGAFTIAPDYCVIVDVDFATSPDSKPHEGKPLGSGTVIARGPNMNRALADRLIALAKEKDIKHTVSVEAGDSGTNARVIQTARSGVMTALLGIPLRYMHSPTEVLCAEDVEATAVLICEALKGGVFNA